MMEKVSVINIIYVSSTTCNDETVEYQYRTIDFNLVLGQQSSMATVYTYSVFITIYS